MENFNVDPLVDRIKVMANEHHKTPEVRYLFGTRFTPARARTWTIHQAYFVRNRRDCWALAMGQAPLDVKREIWLHEQDELISDPRAAGEDHYTLTTREAKLLGVTEADIEHAELHPFVAAAFEAWLHLGKKDWLQSFVSVAMVEAINSGAIVPTGGFSYQSRERLVADLGIPRESLVNRNVHVEADQEHALVLERVLRRHVTSPATQAVVIDSIKKTLIIDRAYRAGLAFVMNQIPESQAA
jgi:hypothetical protein